MFLKLLFLQKCLRNLFELHIFSKNYILRDTLLKIRHEKKFKTEIYTVSL